MLMKHLIMTTALSLAIAVPTASFAADTSSTAAADSTAINAKKFLHADVRDPQGDKIGDVESVLLSKSGQSEAVIVDVGGFLGMGEHRVALNWNELQVANNGKDVTAKYTKDQLKAMPEYAYSDKSKQNTAFYDPNYTGTTTTTTRSGGGSNTMTTTEPTRK